MRWMSYQQAAAYLPVAERTGVSAVARGADGFMGVYGRVKTAARMRREPFSRTQTWGARRRAFLARHLPQYRAHPTPRRWLAMVMWAYRASPPPGIRVFLEDAR